MSGRWFTAAAAARDPTVGEIHLFDDIGFFGMSAIDFHASRRALGDVKRIDLHIDSGGGEVGTAIAMFNMLKQHPAKVHVDDVAASGSAATLVQNGRRHDRDARKF